MKNSKKVAIYLRVSTLDQTSGMESQHRALKNFCTNNGLVNRKWYRDKLSGKDTNRPAFKRLQKDVFDGKVNTVVCWKLDRLSRSLQDGVNILCNWIKRDIRIIAITQQLDFSGVMGKAMAGMLFAFAEMGRENLRENTKRGLAAAKAKGVKLGKRPLLFTKDIIPLLNKGMNVAKVAEKLDVTRQAIYKCFRREGIKITS